MKKYIKLFLIIFLLLSLTTIMASSFPKEIIILGDSLSDSGNAGPGTPAPSNPFTIGFPAIFVPKTNGTTWIVHLSRKLETNDLLPRVQGGTNFAYSGALTIIDLFSISLASQITLIPKDISKKTPVFVWGGANNILLSPLPNCISAAQGAAEDIANILDNLHGKKFKTLIALNLFNLGSLPYSTVLGNSAIYQQASLEFNQRFLTMLQKRSFPVIAIDIASFYKDIEKNLLKYGFSFPTSSVPNSTAILPNNLGATPAGYMYWYDGIHPTEATHKLISDYVFSILTAPYCYSKLSDEPFGVLREQRTNIHQQLSPIQPKHDKKRFYTFVSGTYTPLLSLPSQDFGCNGNIMGGNVCLGLTNRVFDSWTFGVSGGYSFDYIDSADCHRTCNFDLQTGTLSLFAGFEKHALYLNGIIDVSWLFFDDIHRVFVTGPVTHKTYGKTVGMDYDAEVYGAYYVASGCNYQTGPIIDLNYQKVFIDGYKESGADIGNIKYKDQSNSILSTGLGWEVTLNNRIKSIDLITDMYLIFNRQWLGDKRYICFQEVSLPEVWGEWPIEKHQMNFLSGGINFSFLFSNGIVGSFGYACNVGTFNTEEHFLTIGLTIPFGSKSCMSLDTIKVQ